MDEDEVLVEEEAGRHEKGNVGHAGRQVILHTSAPMLQFMWW